MMHSTQHYNRLSFLWYIAYHCGVPLEVELSAVSFPTFTCFHDVVVVAAAITPPLPRDRGTTRTAIQVHAVNLIETRLGE